MKDLSALFAAIILLYCININAQWVQIANGLGTNDNIDCLVGIGSNIFAGVDTNGVFLSTNNGTNWMAVNNGLPMPYTHVWEQIAMGTSLFAGFHGDGVFKSTNNGGSWVAVNNGLTNFSIRSFAVSGTNLFAGTSGGVFQSSNYGTNWSTLNSGLPANAQIEALEFLGTTLFAGDDGFGVFISTNNGVNWDSANNGLTDLHIRTFSVLGTSIFAGTKTGIFKSTNSGINWFAVNSGLPVNPYIRSSDVSGSNIFIGTEGVYLSTNNGISWVGVNQGFATIPFIASLIIANNYIIAGTYEQSIWRRPLAEIIGVKSISTEIPSSFSLSQNYPNPFNPSTFIKFDVSKSSFVTLKMFDALGREVAVLVNESLKPGTYQADWNASNYPSGVYYYKMISGDFAETKKMILIK